MHKIAQHCRQRNSTIVEEPHVRHPNGSLFKPDIAVISDRQVIIVDIGISWAGDADLKQAHLAKKAVYNNNIFIEAANAKWPDKSIIIEPIILGARGIWPNANKPAETLLHLPPQLKTSCVNTVLKWGPTIHNYFSRVHTKPTKEKQNSNSMFPNILETKSKHSGNNFVLFVFSTTFCFTVAWR